MLRRGALAGEEGRGPEAATLLAEAATLAAEVNDPSGALLAQLWAVLHAGGDLAAARAAFDAAQPRMRLDARLECSWLLWRAARSPGDLLAARALLAEQQAHVPPAPAPPSSRTCPTPATSRRRPSLRPPTGLARLPSSAGRGRSLS